jgi:glycosyltransferase involved in cell wall biosynthesis
VIPTYNRADVLARTLQHLVDQDYPAASYEIIVVDNSTDETPAVVAAAARAAPVPIRLFAHSDRLPAVKRNLGLRAATGEYVLFMNDDVWADPCLLREHAASHAAHDQPIAVLGHVDQSPEMPRTPFLDWYQPFAYFELAGLGDQAVPYRYCWSINLSLPREEMLGRGLLFHEDWAEIGHEDVELGYRWTSAGRQVVYNPRARGLHYHPHTLDSACRLQESIGRGLRDLERLVPDPHLLERYGVLSWRNRPRAVARGLVRQLLFNGATMLAVQRWLNRQRRNSTLTRWLYWKVMLHYTNRGYRQAPPRFPRPLPILSPVGADA